MESVVTTHEVIHSIHHSNVEGLVLKLDYEKAYDKVNWNFLYNILSKRGFGPKWCLWFYEAISKDSVGELTRLKVIFFQTGKGVSQGDPLSTNLFNLVAGKVGFWEGLWFGSASLAIKFWDLYVLVNEKGDTNSDLWDGFPIKCTFKRTFSDNMMLRWYELENIASCIQFNSNEDSLTWSY